MFELTCIMLGMGEEIRRFSKISRVRTYADACDISKSYVAMIKAGVKPEGDYWFRIISQILYFTYLLILLFRPIPYFFMGFYGLFSAFYLLPYRYKYSRMFYFVDNIISLSVLSYLFMDKLSRL